VRRPPSDPPASRRFRPPLHRPRGAGLAALLALVPALALAGCGSSAAPGADPAAIVPATAPFYASATVRPSGPLQTNATADARKLTHQHNAYGALLGALSLRGPGGSVGRAEVDAWLGERAGLFLMRAPAHGLSSPADALALLREAIGGGLFTRARAAGGVGASGALVLDVTDTAKARRFLRAQTAGRAVSLHTYRGVAYSLTDLGEAYALVGRFLVLGSQTGMQEAIATEQGAQPGLPHDAEYAALHAGAPEGALASVFVRLGGGRAAAARGASGRGGASGSSGSSTASTEAATAEAPSSETASAEAAQSAGQTGEAGAGEAGRSSPATPLGALVAFANLPGGAANAVYVSLVPQHGQIRLDLDALPAGALQAPSTSESEQSQAGQQVFQGLPEGSWAAVGVEDLPATVESLLAVLPSLLGTTGAGSHPGHRPTPAQEISALAGTLGPLSGLAAPVERLVRTLETHRAKLRSALSGWMGPVGLFVSGSSLLELNAAAVISSRDPARSRAAVATLGELLQSAGAKVHRETVPGAEEAITALLGGLPVPLEIAAAGSKLVVGVGVSPAQVALSPTATLGGSSAYRSALATLGEGLSPRVLLDMPTLLAFAGQLGLSGNRTFSQLEPYLRSLSAVTVGTGRIGSAMRTAVVLRLQ
jgi:hypothetical protein